jgi:F420-dependent oxidoreductase-like protein
MKLAVHCANLSWPGGPAALGPTLASVARTADDGGVTTVTMMDHWFQMEYLGGPAAPMLEGYTSLGFLAGQTERVQLGLLVTGVTYRHPGLLAKVVTTLDVLSGGRAFLGIGAAWYEREHRAFGVPFPPLSERFERLEEAVRICRQMWSEDDGPFEGRHYRLDETIVVPPALQAGGPPILVGGSGERKTLRLVARHADACNLYGFDPEEMKHKLDVLDGHCADVGRDPAEVRRTALADGDPFEDLDAFLRRMEAYAGLGIDEVWVMPPAEDPVGHVGRLCDEVLPRLRDLG